MATQDDLATSVSASLSNAALSLALAAFMGPDGAALLTAASGPIVNVLAQRRVRQEQRARQLIDDTLHYTDTTEEGLAGWAGSHPSHADLLSAAVAAAHTTNDSVSEKVRAMARALAEGVLRDDPAVLDHSALVIQALEGLDRPHLVALRGLVEEEEEGAGEWRHLVLSWDKWLANVPYSSSTLTRIESELTREGMLEVYVYPVDDVEDPQLPNDAHQGKYYAVSEFGFDILQELHQVASGGTAPA